MMKSYTIKEKIEHVMTADPAAGKGPVGALLRAGSLLYGAGVGLKNTGYDTGLLVARKLPCRIISIGNIVAGGTGKTPMTIYTASLLKQMGHRPVVLSRGYGGRAEKKGIVVSDGYEILCDPETAGDEPFMMASKIRGVPVLVGGDRYKSGMRAVLEFEPDVIVLDDGFQHRRLHRDLDLVLVDAARMFGNGCLLPRGMLREPISALGRSDAIVLTRCGIDCDTPAGLVPDFDAKPVFRTDHATFLSGVMDGTAPLPHYVPPENPESGFSRLADSRVFAFSGIARNQTFLDAVENKAKGIAGHRAFPDHHRYTDAEIGQIASDAASAGADVLVTTEKDYVRVAGRVPGDIPVAVIGVKIVFMENDASEFIDFIRQRLWEN